MACFQGKVSWKGVGMIDHKPAKKKKKKDVRWERLREHQDEHDAEGTICNRLFKCLPKSKGIRQNYNLPWNNGQISSPRPRESLCDLLLCCQFPLTRSLVLTPYGQHALGQAISDSCCCPSCHAPQLGVLSTSALDWFLETGNI